MSPPTEEAGPYQGPATSPKTTTNSHHATGSLHSNNVARQLRDRRAGSRRLAPLVCGHADPWQPWRPKALSDKLVDGYADAIGHLEDLGLTPAALTPETRAMWSRGGDDRATASRVVRRWAA